MKRAIVLAVFAVLAVAVWAWADVDIFVHGSGSGSVTIEEHVYTPAGEIHEWFEAYGDWSFDKNLSSYEGPGYGGLLEWKSFYVDGYVNFYEDIWVYAPPFLPGPFEMGAFVEVRGDGLIFFEKFADLWMDIDYWSAGLYQDVYVDGYFYDGLVYTGHVGWTDDYWIIDQYYENHIWVPMINIDEIETALLFPGEGAYFGVDAWFHDEPFSVWSYISDYAW